MEARQQQVGSCFLPLPQARGELRSAAFCCCELGCSRNRSSSQVRSELCGSNSTRSLQSVGGQLAASANRLFAAVRDEQIGLPSKAGRALVPGRSGTSVVLSASIHNLSGSFQVKSVFIYYWPGIRSLSHTKELSVARQPVSQGSAQPRLRKAGRVEQVRQAEVGCWLRRFCSCCCGVGGGDGNIKHFSLH